MAKHYKKMTLDYLQIVNQLEMLPHPEGGYYKEEYRSKDIIPNAALPQFSGDRNFCTSIYFLLTSENFSGFHRIKQDEIWHFYSGSPLAVHVIDEEGIYTKHIIGMDILDGKYPQLTVPANCWFASSVVNENDYSFVGCTVAPGFDFDDFELAKKEELSAIYPQHKSIIEKLTRI
jgi:uncharacterized protein